MDDALLAEYRASTYLVCLDTLQWAPIRIDASLPGSLQHLVGERAWAFITAWNPRSIKRPDRENDAAQKALRAALLASDGLAALYPGVGIGSNGWYEPGFFVVGLEPEVLDMLGTAHAQNAYVCGRGASQASLRMLCAVTAATGAMDIPPWHCGQSRK